MRANWLDRAIAVVAPRAAARRVAARSAFDMISRGYDAAAQGRRNAGWRRVSSGADAEIAAAGPLLRDGMRELVRNNPHAAKAIATLVGNFVGDGISPRPKTGDDKRDAKIRALWDRWSTECDADGQLDFYGLQTLAVREMLEAGEVLVRRRNRRASDGIEVPVQIQILEADHLDSGVEGAQAGTNYAVQGVEFDQIGRRVAYHLYPQHPGNTFINLNRAATQSVRIPASQVLHVYEKQRTQVRGVPWGTPSMSSAKDLGEYEDAEIIRKKIEACMVGVVVGGDDLNGLGAGIPMDGNALPPGVYDAAGAAVERFEPGMFAYARGGKDIKFNTPGQNGTYEQYKRASLHTIAAGFRVPYELLTGDLSQVSFISGRMGLLEFRRLISAVQWQILIPMLCRPVWRWFGEAAFAAGLVDDPAIPVEWDVPENTTLDPLNEEQAAGLAMRNGTRSWDEVVAAKGRDPDAVMNEIAARFKKFDALGIVLDSDPRNTAKSGALQVAETAPSGAANDKPPPAKK